MFDNYEGVISKEVHNIIFKILYVLFLCVTLFGVTFYAQYYKSFKGILLIGILLSLIVLEILYGKFSLRSIGVMIIVVLLCLPVLINVGVHNQATILLCIMFLFSGRNIEFREILKTSLITSSIVLGVTIFSSKIGIIENFIADTAKGKREFIGFLYALYPSTIFFNISIISIYLLKNSSRIKTTICFLILGIINYYIYSKTNGDLNYGLTNIALVLFYIMYMLDLDYIKLKPILYMICFSFIICLIISYIICNHYNPRVEWQADLNEYLEGRIYYAYTAIKNYGYKPFGQSIAWVGHGLNAYGEYEAEGKIYNFVDNMYIQIMLNYGVIFTLGVVLVFTISSFRCVSKGEWIIPIIIAFIAVHSMIDDLLLYVFYNTFWFAFSVKLGTSDEETLEIDYALDSKN